jgi:hypothetical protein
MGKVCFGGTLNRSSPSLVASHTETEPSWTSSRGRNVRFPSGTVTVRVTMKVSPFSDARLLV